MATAQTGVILRHIRKLVAEQSQRQVADHELLQRFATQADEAAFAELVRRHGAMVLRVCQRRLRHVQDAEDVFQATFLTLARKAASIRKQDAVGSWLHGVAANLSLRAKTAATRRQRRESRAVERPPEDPLAEISLREARTVIDEELAKLPEKYRAPLVLCYLEGATRDEAAQQLGWSLGTLKRRLEQGRELLRGRLARRDLTLSAILAAGLLAQNVGQGAISAPLVDTTVRAALLFAAGKQAAAGMVSAGAIALLQGVTRAMFWTKLKIVTVLLLAVGLCATGVGLRAHPAVAPPTALQQSEPPQPPAKVTEPPAAKGNAGKAQPAALKDRARDSIVVSGQVLGPDGKPLARAKVYLWMNTTKDKSALAIRDVAEADGDGRFRFSVLRKDAGPDGTVVAWAKDHGPDWADLDKPEKDRDVTLRLVKDVPINGRVLDLEGQPIAGVTVEVLRLEKTANDDLKPWFEAQSRGQYPSMKNLGAKLLEEPISLTTGKDGRFRFTGFGRERIVALQLRGPNIENAQFWVITRPGSLTGFRPGNHGTYPATFDHLAPPIKPIVGTVREKGTGKPLAGITVGSMAYGNVYTKTDEQGRYRIVGAGKHQEYAVAAGGIPYFNCTKMHIADTPGVEPITVDFELERGIAIQGTLIDKATGKPVRGYVTYTPLAENPHVKDFADLGKPQILVDRRGEVGADGSFTVVAIPGPGLLCARAHDTDHFLGAKVEGWKTTSRLILQGYHGLLRIDPSEGDPKSTICTIGLEPGRTLTGSVVGPDGQPLAGAHAAGRASITLFDAGRRKLETASFTVGGLSPDRSRVLVFIHPERKLAKIQKVRGDETGPLTIRLEPLGTITGRILDAGGRPAAGLKVAAAFNITDLDSAQLMGKDYRDLPMELLFDYPSWSKLTNREATTDDNGKFRIEELVPGLKYNLALKNGEIKESFMVESGKIKDLGELKTKPAQ
jgi:RNA polymerase sigma factor (sigma-70 family)